MSVMELLGLPLSAYTPGRGDISMEGKWETATGAPMYTLEMYQRGEAPYVTAASSNKGLFGKEVWRTIGDRVVPLKITDYGPGVKGLDIAFENPKYATNFPFQGQRDTKEVVGPDKTQTAPRTVDWENALRSAPAQQQRGAMISDAFSRLGSSFAQQRPSVDWNAINRILNNPVFTQPLNLG